MYNILKVFLCKIRFRFVNWFCFVLFCIFQIILLPNIMPYPIITTLDSPVWQGRNKQKRYRQTLFVTYAGSQWPFGCLDIFFQIFAKNVNWGSDEYEIWCVEQFGRVKEKTQNSFFVTPAVHGANIIQIFVTIFSGKIWRGFLLPRSTGPQHMHQIQSLF